MLGQRRRRLANIETSSGECLVFAGLVWIAKTQYLFTVKYFSFSELFFLSTKLGPKLDLVLDAGVETSEARLHK